MVQSESNSFVRRRIVSMVQPAIHCQSIYLTMFAISILFVTTIPTIVNAMRNPYEILGVKQSASITEIKHQYKQMVRNWHPDKNSDPEAEAKFIEINKAYEVIDSLFITETKPNCLITVIVRPGKKNGIRSIRDHRRYSEF